MTNALLKKLLKLTSDDETRDGVNMPFVVGDNIYFTDGRIIAKSEAPRAKTPADPEAVFPVRDMEFRKLSALPRPSNDDFPTVAFAENECGDFVAADPIKPAVVHPCKVGGACIAARFINLLFRDFPDAEIEVNSPGTNIGWRSVSDGITGVIMGMRSQFNRSVWVWDLVDGGYVYLELSEQ